MYEEMIESGAWWDFVDEIAKHRVSAASIVPRDASLVVEAHAVEPLPTGAVVPALLFLAGLAVVLEVAVEVRQCAAGDPQELVRVHEARQSPPDISAARRERPGRIAS